MTRPGSPSGIRRSAPALLPMLALLAPACGGDDAVIQTPTLERPVAVGFARDGNTLWALIANSVRGEVALADVSTEGVSRIRDLDPVSPGFQMLSVGRQIADIAVSPGSIGGRPAPVVAVTANAGSCDLGLIDVQELISGSAPVANTVRPAVGGTPLHARPHAIAFVPGTAAEVYATFPNCGLVARVDLATGEVVQALQILADGRADIGPAPSCPVECGSSADPCASGGCPATALALDLDVADDGSLLVVSSVGAPLLTVVVLDRDGAMSYARVVPLEGGVASGKVRVSPSTRFGRFAYVAARDGSVRVASLSEFRECETNADPSTDPALLAGGCAPLDGTILRRPLARGPGIDLARAGPTNVVLPVDVTFVALDAPSGDAGSATYYDGVFAFVLGSDGQVVVVDVEDRAYPDAMPHTIRSGVPRIEGNDGTFRREAPLVSDMSRGRGAQPAPDHRYPELQATSDDPQDVGVRFPEPLRTPDDQVTLRYEGVLPATNRAQGVIDYCSGATGPVCVRDPGAAFCSRGVEAGDLVELVACTDDSQCRSGIEICFRDPSVAIEDGGLCVCDEDADPGQDRCMDRGRQACRRLLTARREYPITAARSGELELDASQQDLDPSCFPSPIRYQVRAANALLVGSVAVGYAHRIVADLDGTCIPDASRSPMVQAKIALDPPPCVDSAAPAPNPCRTRDLVRARHPLYDLTVARPDDTDDLSSRTPGQSFSIVFDVAGSFSRFSSDTSAFLPVAVELAPDGLLYFVDEGDVIFGNVRGRLIRMDPRTADTDDRFSVF